MKEPPLSNPPATFARAIYEVLPDHDAQWPWEEDNGRVV